MREVELPSRGVVAIAFLGDGQRHDRRRGCGHARVHLGALLAEKEQFAHAADDALARGAAVGPLHGLPIAHKDLILTKGIRTTYGSRIYADFVPDQDMLIVERMRHAGAITIGKTNTPEFGAGSQTFNPDYS